MNKKNLALFCSTPLIKKNIKIYNSFANPKNEIRAAVKVIKSGILSSFIGSKGDKQNGGIYVKKFERNCAKFFNVNHAITVNSWTSGLIVAIGAIGIEPGDEIITTPWTMCASATAILHWNAIPVFADINPETFCIDPRSIEKKISKYTKAIIAVDIFGQSCDMHNICKIAKNFNLKIISDSAQSPGAFYKNKYAGTLADIGGFSLNYHKHIHTGEGGILVTNNGKLANKMRLIRNHAEAIVTSNNKGDLVNMIGYNFRLGEIEAAIGIEQLKKLKKQVRNRQNIAKKLNKGLRDLTGLILPKLTVNSTHVYYFYAMRLDLTKIKTTRDKIFFALKAEGVPVINKYQNIHLLPVYQKKIAYGSKGFPWNIFKRKIDYSKGICPIAETLNEKTFIGIPLCLYDPNTKDISLIIKAFEKVWKKFGIKNQLGETTLVN
jgi:dTDP-4-amino-4,6-dideoxygalactose transaminase